MTTRRCIAILALLSLCCWAFAQRPFAAPTDAKKLDNVVYAKVGARELHADIVMPKDAPAKPHPCVVWIHGGGWSNGTHKANQAAWLAGKGYVAASVEDRLVPIAQSEGLYEALQNADVSVTFVRVRNAGHGVTGVDIKPTREEINAAVLTFFDKKLKNGK